MRITKGQPWGSATQLPAGAPIATSNEELRSFVERALADYDRAAHDGTAHDGTAHDGAAHDGAAAPPPVVGLAGGDIWAAVGGSSSTAGRLDGDKTHGVLIDAICVQADLATSTATSTDSSTDLGTSTDGNPATTAAGSNPTGQHWACAHVVARRHWYSGQVVAVMNSEWLGRWRVAPAAHPGDGRLNIVETTPSYRRSQRFLARRRLLTGDHLPHPGLKSRRITEATFDFAKPLNLWVDGTNVGRTRSLAVKVVPAAIKIVF